MHANPIIQETYWFHDSELRWQQTTAASYQHIKAWGGTVRLGSEGVVQRRQRRRKSDTSPIATIGPADRERGAA